MRTKNSEVADMVRMALLLLLLLFGLHSNAMNHTIHLVDCASDSDDSDSDSLSTIVRAQNFFVSSIALQFAVSQAQLHGVFPPGDNIAFVSRFPNGTSAECLMIVADSMQDKLQNKPLFVMVPNNDVYPSYLASTFEVPAVSFALNTPSLSVRETHPWYLRLSPPEQLEFETIFQLCKAVGWKQIVFFYGTNEQFVVRKDWIKKAASKIPGVEYWIVVHKQGSESSIDEELRMIKASNRRLLAIYSSQQDGMAVFQKTLAYGMLSQGYQVIMSPDCFSGLYVTLGDDELKLLDGVMLPSLPVTLQMYSTSIIQYIMATMSLRGSRGFVPQEFLLYQLATRWIQLSANLRANGQNCTGRPLLDAIRAADYSDLFAAPFFTPTSNDLSSQMSIVSFRWAENIFERVSEVAIYFPQQNNFTLASNIVYLGGESTPPDSSPPPKYIQPEKTTVILLSVLAGFPILLSLGCLVMIAVSRNNAIFRASSVPFVTCIASGALCLAISVELNMVPQLDAACTTSALLLDTGLVLIFGSISVKTARISRIFNTVVLTTNSPQGISNRALFGQIAMPMTYILFLHVLWEASGTSNVKVLPIDGSQFQMECTVADIWFILRLICPGILLLSSLYFAIQVRAVQRELFNESKTIGFIVYLTVLVATSVGLLYPFQKSIEARLTVWNGGILVADFSTITAYFAPKLIALFESNRSAGPALSPMLAKTLLFSEASSGDLLHGPPRATSRKYAVTTHQPGLPGGIEE